MRSAFGKSKLVRDGEHVLVACSGGTASTALQHLIQEGKSERTQRKLRFTPALVYIDESVIVGLDDDDRKSINTAVLAKLQEANIPAYYYTIEQVYDESLQPQPISDNPESDLERCMSSMTLEHSANVNKIQQLLKEAGSLTAQEHLQQSLRQQFLIKIARTLGFSKVLLADTASRLSVRLLSNITQGRGAHLPLDLSFQDNRHGDVAFLRPMREFTAKEVAMYNSLNNLTPVFCPALSTKTSTLASLDRLTEDFVYGLQAHHPNTVSTIYRTGDKLSLADASQNDTNCVMCHAPLDTNTSDCSALASTTFSQSLASKESTNHTPSLSKPSSHSTVGDQNATISTNQSSCKNAPAEKSNDPCVDGENSCCGGGACQSSSTSSEESMSEFVALLCYGCRLVCKHLTSTAHFPPAIRDEAGKRIRRNHMKDSIADFLLDEL